MLSHMLALLESGRQATMPCYLGHSTFPPPSPCPKTMKTSMVLVRRTGWHLFFWYQDPKTTSFNNLISFYYCSFSLIVFFFVTPSNPPGEETVGCRARARARDRVRQAYNRPTVGRPTAGRLRPWPCGQAYLITCLRKESSLMSWTSDSPHSFLILNMI